jgi:hypothetical protein
MEILPMASVQLAALEQFDAAQGKVVVDAL